MKYNKKLIDAVNALQGDLDGLKSDCCTVVIKCKEDYREDGIFKVGDLDLGTAYLNPAKWKVICTIEEFNQCVEEMMTSGNYNEFYSYVAASKQPLTKENSDYSFYGGKPEIKIEYVEVNPNEDGGAFWECARDFACGLAGVFHWKDFYGEFKVIQDNEQLIKYYKLRNLYRKVETEISPKELLIEQVAHNVREHCYPNYQKDNPNPCATYFEETLKVLSELGHLK